MQPHVDKHWQLLIFLAREGGQITDAPFNPTNLVGRMATSPQSALNSDQANPMGQSVVQHDRVTATHYEANTGIHHE